MVALTPISKGQQIFNDYGQLPRSDLLVSKVLGVMSLCPIRYQNHKAQTENVYTLSFIGSRQSILKRHADSMNTKRRYGYVTENYKKWDVGRYTK